MTDLQMVSLAITLLAMFAALEFLVILKREVPPEPQPPENTSHSEYEVTK